jgi:hypothetical protein
MIWPGLNQRLSRLYDAKFDGDSIDEEVFKIKENEYKASITEIKSQIRTLGDGNSNFYQDACRTLELSKRLFPLFLESSYEDKANILKLLASNYSLVNASDVSILPRYRKPFDIIAEGPSRPSWLHRVDEFRNYFLYDHILERNPDISEVELAIGRM